jgi:hypothetical protein
MHYVACCFNDEWGIELLLPTAWLTLYVNRYSKIPQGRLQIHKLIKWILPAVDSEPNVADSTVACHFVSFLPFLSQIFQETQPIVRSQSWFATSSSPWSRAQLSYQSLDDHLEVYMLAPIHHLIVSHHFRDVPSRSVKKLIPIGILCTWTRIILCSKIKGLIICLLLYQYYTLFLCYPYLMFEGVLLGVH